MIDVVCGVIENSQGEFLVCLRPQGKHLAGLWEFPGGKVEAGENHAAALFRELREELCIEVEISQALSSVEWHYEKLTIHLHPYHCRLLNGKPKPIEHEQLLWCTTENFESLPWAPADVPIYKELLALTRVRPSSTLHTLEMES